MIINVSKWPERPGNRHRKAAASPAMLSFPLRSVIDDRIRHEGGRQRGNDGASGEHGQQCHS
jgi:hypothetical protein